MADYILSCCSTADLPAEYFAERNVAYTCFHYNMDGKEYTDDLGKSMPFDEFYRRIADGAQPTTSQVNVQQYLDYFEPFLKEGKDVTIVSADKDLMQLIRPGVEFYDGMKNKFFTPEDVKEKFGVYPERVTDVQALAGDSTDNIPGIPGIGLKTAAELVNMFGSLEGVLEHAAEIKQNKRRELVMAHKEDALISQKLVTLKPDVPVELPLQDLRCMAPHQDILLSLLERHAFKSLKNKTLNWLKQRCAALPEEKKTLTPVYTLLANAAELPGLAAAIAAENAFAFKAHTAGNKLLGVSVGLKDARAYYIPLAAETASAADLFAAAPTAGEGVPPNKLKDFLQNLFANPAILKISLNLKENLHILADALQTDFAPFPYDDVAIMSYGLHSSAATHTLPALAAEFLALPLKSAAPEYKKADFAAMSAKDALAFFAEEADCIRRLSDLFAAELLPEKKLVVYEPNYGKWTRNLTRKCAKFPPKSTPSPAKSLI